MKIHKLVHPLVPRPSKAPQDSSTGILTAPLLVVWIHLLEKLVERTGPHGCLDVTNEHEIIVPQIASLSRSSDCVPDRGLHSPDSREVIGRDRHTPILPDQRKQTTDS